MMEEKTKKGGVALHVSQEDIKVIFEHLDERIEKITFDLRQPNGVQNDRYIKELKDIFFLLETMKSSLGWEQQD